MADRVASARRFSPSSLRSRLVIAFGLGSTILLVLTAALLYLRFNAEIEGAVDQVLAERAGDVVADVEEGNVQVGADEPFVLLLDRNGVVVDATTKKALANPVLSARELTRASRGEVVVDRRRVNGLGKRARLLARPARAPDGSVVIVVVGESLETVTRATERLGILLATIAPVLIGAIAGSGWVLAGAALRPVRRMTEEAEAISALESGRRLPQAAGDDEIAHLGHTLNAMLDRIEASLAHERSFVDDASHELRTPLSILRGELELALADPDDRAAVSEALRTALEEAERLSRLSDDLLVLARADQGRLGRPKDDVDLLATAQAVAARYSSSAPPGVEVDGRAMRVSADPVLLDRVLGNLLDNARRHARTRVSVLVSGDEGHAHLVVADDGSGFPPSLLPVALDRFTRGDSARNRGGGGSGLGLAIVKGIVAAQGGAVTVGNGPPLGGGRVEVRLPLAANGTSEGDDVPTGSAQQSVP